MGVITKRTRMRLALVPLASIAVVVGGDAVVDTFRADLARVPKTCGTFFIGARSYEATPLIDDVDCMEARRVLIASLSDDSACEPLACRRRVGLGALRVA